MPQPSQLSPPPALGLDTTGPTLRLGLSNFVDINYHQAWEVGRDLSLYLHQHLAKFIQPSSWSDLAWLAVAKGPGSYTGTRIGVVTARTLAQQLNLPLYGVSTLAMFAWAYFTTEHCQPATQIAVDMPAQQGHIHGGIYQLGTDQTLVRVSCDSHYSNNEWEKLVSQKNIPHRLSSQSNTFSSLSLSQALLAIGQQHSSAQNPQWDSVLPYYN